MLYDYSVPATLLCVGCAVTTHHCATAIHGRGVGTPMHFSIFVVKYDQSRCNEVNSEHGCSCDRQWGLLQLPAQTLPTWLNDKTLRGVFLA